MKLAERELKRAQRAAERERAKAGRAAERIRLKAEAKAEKLAGAEGGYVELPAVVLRGGTVRHVTDIEAWDVMSAHLDDMCLDIEHSGFPLGHALYELRTVQLGGEHMAVVFDAADPEQMKIASLALTLSAKIRAYSVTADAIPCVAAGLIAWDDIWAKLYDGVFNAKLNDPKMSGSDADALKELARDILREYAVSPEAEKAKNALFAAMGCLTKTELTTPPEKNGWHRVNRNSVVMTRYAGSDVLDLAAVIRVLPPIPVSEAVVDREREFQEACAVITYAGFALDAAHIKAKIAEFEAAREEARKNVLVLSEGKIVNPKSPDVIKFLPEVIPGLVLPPHRKTKQPTADKGALEKLSRDRRDEPLTFHLLKQILDYRHCDTTLGLLLRPMENLCDHGDARMRPTIYTIEASTGRTSARRPNAQQFARQGGIRASVVADPGFLGISADFEGCELRVAAGLSGDRGLLEAETSGRCHACSRNPCECGKEHKGLHWLAAHEAFGIEATKEHRYWCKRGIFAKLFGGGPETAAAQAFCDIAPMEKIFAAFEALAPAYTEWDKWLRHCYREGSMVWRDYETGQNFSQKIDGSKHLVYRAYSGRNIYIVNGEHAAGNGAIQGTARELLVDGVLNWKKTKWGGRAILPVHDEIDVFVPAGDAPYAAVELKRCMETTVLSSPGMEVRIGADVSEPFTAWPDSS